MLNLCRWWLQARRVKAAKELRKHRNDARRIGRDWIRVKAEVETNSAKDPKDLSLQQLTNLMAYTFREWQESYDKMFATTVLLAYSEGEEEEFFRYFVRLEQYALREVGFVPKVFNATDPTKMLEDILS
ncbi:hypothetical protein [Vibrio phage vB_VmeM-Yong XC32]|nr:hypothetical protein [Vibrio phage vB_VmeM-Yong XC31]QAX96507.1 hypothetical protein [Vibrio phage vB_VmeM-Yong XC32]QAX96824.1 hypothetical protein [Vibrio phage vB_VmeM-Yong MS31]QAX97143.1 hypothetical protein [Vibrio phage vB_VmeM-Yong MS32]